MRLNRRQKLAARAILLACGACCLALISKLPAYEIQLTIGGIMFPAFAGALGVGEMNDEPPQPPAA